MHRKSEVNDSTLRQASNNAFRKGRIAPYPVPSAACIALNKVKWPLDPNDAVLLVHDMQPYWLDFFEDAAPLVKAIETLVDAARAKGIPIVFSKGERPTHPAERALALEMWGLGLADPAVPPHEAVITAPVSPKSDDFVIDKVRVSAFFETPLAGLLAKLGRRQIWICGVFAHHGVMITSVEAFMRNYKVQLIADALGDYSEDDHWMALRYVAQTCGHIQTLRMALDALESKAQ